MCAQRRLKPVCAFSQYDHNLRCPYEETLRPWLSKMRPLKILIRLRECAGWSESSWAHMYEGTFSDDMAHFFTFSGGKNIHVIDISDATNMIVMYHTSVEGVDITDVEVCGEFVFVAMNNLVNKEKGTVKIYRGYNEVTGELELIHTITGMFQYKINQSYYRWKWFRWIYTILSFTLLKKSILRGTNLLPVGANSFLLEKTPFQKGVGVQECKQKVTKVIPLCQKMAENLPSNFIHLKNNMKT